MNIVQGKTPLHTKLAGIETAVRAEILNSDEQMHVALLGVVAKAHVFLIGLPGIGKSMLADRIRIRIDCRQFKKQFSPFTKDGEVLGPVLIPDANQPGPHVLGNRVPDGFLPWADIAVLDEVFNANSAVLNTLQELILEGTWHNNGRTEKAPLNLLFAMSNRLPGADRDELAAFYDRLLLRHEVPAEMSRADMLALFALPEPDPSPPVVLTMDDVLAIQADAAALPITDDAAAAAADIIGRVRADGHLVSPRRARAGVARVARAAAWLEGATEVQAHHMECLVHVLWDKPEQRPAVERVVIEVCSPLSNEILELTDGFVDVQAQVDELVRKFEANEGDSSFMRAVVDVQDKIKDVASDVLRLNDETLTGRAAVAWQSLRDDITLAAQRLAGMLGGLPDQAERNLWEAAEKAVRDTRR